MIIRIIDYLDLVCHDSRVSLCLSLCLCLSLSLSLSVSLSISLSVSPSLSLFVCISLPLSLSFSPSLSLCLSLFLPLSLCLCLCLSLPVFLYLSLSVSHSLSPIAQQLKTYYSDHVKLLFRQKKKCLPSCISSSWLAMFLSNWVSRRFIFGFNSGREKGGWGVGLSISV